MIEMLLSSSKHSSNIIDIDFSRQNLGDNFIIDHYGNKTFSVARGTPGQVVLDTSLNKKVMQFTGAVFSCSNLNLKQDKGFIIEVQFKASVSTSAGIFATGMYPDEVGRVPGISFAINQYPENYIQLFLDPGGANWKRLFFNGPNTSQWENLRITYTPGVSWVLEKLTTGEKVTYPAYGFGPGTGLNFALGGYLSPSDPYYFKGSIARLKINLI